MVLENILGQRETQCRLGSVAEVSIHQDGWCDHGPEVDGCCQPGGDDLHPHGPRVVVEGGDVGGDGGTVPVGEGHHDIKRSQGKHHMEEGPAVSHLKRNIFFRRL